MIAEKGRSVCVIAGIDLAHIGGRFGDSEPTTIKSRAQIERDDRKMLEHVVSVDPDAMCQSMLDDQDVRRMCGYPAL
jgi:hypothetical protein